MWVVVAIATRPWRHILLYATGWTWIPALLLFATGFVLYAKSGSGFSAKQLGGLPEIHHGNRDQRLVTDGIRACVRHPVYAAHLCEMLAWSTGIGLAVCWGLTVFAMITGTVMIRMEDVELEKRFGEEYRRYRRNTPAVLPMLRSKRHDIRSRLSTNGTSVHYEAAEERVWQITISNLVCIAEYTTAAGPWADDYFLVFMTRDELFYEASFYSDGRDVTLESLEMSLGCSLRPELIQSATSSSRVLWPAAVEGKPLFIGAKREAVNPDIRNLTQQRQL